MGTSFRGQRTRTASLERGDDRGPAEFAVDVLPQRGRRVGLAVDQVHRVRRECSAEPLDDLPGVSVGREVGHAGDFGADREVLAEHLQCARPVDQIAGPSACGGEPHDGDGVTRVGQQLAQMVERDRRSPCLRGMGARTRASDPRKGI